MHGSRRELVMETDQRPGAPGVGTRIGARFEEAGATPEVLSGPRERVLSQQGQPQAQRVQCHQAPTARHRGPPL